MPHTQYQTGLTLYTTQVRKRQVSQWCTSQWKARAHAAKDVYRARSSQKLVLRAQEALAQERGSKARIVASLRETIAGLRAAGDVEGRLKQELAAACTQLAAAQAAQVRAHACMSAALVPRVMMMGISAASGLGIIVSCTLWPAYS